MATLEFNIKKITGTYLDRYQVLKAQKGGISQTIVPIIKLKEEMFMHLKATGNTNASTPLSDRRKEARTKTGTNTDFTNRATHFFGQSA